MSPADNLIRQLVGFITVTERLAACVRLSSYLIESIRDVHEHDAEVAPELLTAVTAAGELVEALTRAQKFAHARLEVALSDG